jgi:acylaminoacyl-peptidase
MTCHAGLVDESRVAVSGGSHGGLLTGHLIGQHPARFRAGTLRNPVMDVSLMVHVSDIPDWCYCEAWGAEVRCAFDARLWQPG